MTRKEFVEKISVLGKYEKNEITDVPIGMETAIEIALLVDEWNMNYQDMYDIIMKVREGK